MQDSGARVSFMGLRRPSCLTWLVSPAYVVGVQHVQNSNADGACQN